MPPKGYTPLAKKIPHKKSLHFTADWFHHLQIYSSAVGAKILIPTHIHTTSITVQDLHASEDFESSLCTWSYPTYEEEMTKCNYVFSLHLEWYSVQGLESISKVCEYFQIQVFLPVAQKNISGPPVSSVASSTNCQLFNSVRHKVKVFKRRTRRRNRTKSTVELCVPNTFNHNLRTPTSIQS